jgi:hypothetical protein
MDGFLLGYQGGQAFEEAEHFRPSDERIPHRSKFRTIEAELQKIELNNSRNCVQYSSVYGPRWRVLGERRVSSI